MNSLLSKSILRASLSTTSRSFSNVPSFLDVSPALQGGLIDMWRILRSFILLRDVNYKGGRNPIFTEKKGKYGEVYVWEMLSICLLHALKTSSELFL